MNSNTILVNLLRTILLNFADGDGSKNNFHLEPAH